jgi:hypothetical protein
VQKEVLASLHTGQQSEHADIVGDQAGDWMWRLLGAELLPASGRRRFLLDALKENRR